MKGIKKKEKKRKFDTFCYLFIHFILFYFYYSFGGNEYMHLREESHGHY